MGQRSLGMAVVTYRTGHSVVADLRVLHDALA
jgi:hypothetical protein